ncbi:MAG: NAD(P)H-dependent oxidoreductase [Ilumatobacter sp.]|nr:NAD(P)H-dependent oxidoreductase [Ilumatobacter sp.]
MRVLVVHAHPDPESFVAAARDRALDALAAADHEIRCTDLYADGFEPAMTADERRSHHLPGVEPELQRYADDLRWAEALVLVYPTWWSGFPAILKGWIDRVWVAGVAWDLPDGANRLRPRLSNIRRIVAVTSHGSSKFVNALEGESGKRTMTRSIRLMCSKRTRTTWCAIYGVDTCSPADRARFLDRVERTMRRLR